MSELRDDLSRMGSSAAPSGFSQRVIQRINDSLSEQPLNWGLLQFDREECELIRDALRNAAIDRAGRLPHDNHKFRHLFRLSRIFGDVADRS